jgi:hypothetical protein
MRLVKASILSTNLVAERVLAECGPRGTGRRLLGIGPIIQLAAVVGELASNVRMIAPLGYTDTVGTTDRSFPNCREVPNSSMTEIQQALLDSRGSSPSANRIRRQSRVQWSSGGTNTRIWSSCCSKTFPHIQPTVWSATLSSTVCRRPTHLSQANSLINQIST